MVVLKECSTFPLYMLVDCARLGKMPKGYFGADKPTQRETDAATIALEVLDLRMDAYRPSDAGKAKSYELLGMLHAADEVVGAGVEGGSGAGNGECGCRTGESMRQICEYCRSRVERGRTECKNCGAPVPEFHPSYNTYGSPYFEQDLLLGQQSVIPNAYGNIQNVQAGNIQWGYGLVQQYSNPLSGSFLGPWPRR